MSQGCKFACDFCAADKLMAERYRDLDVVEDEITTLSDLASGFGMDKMTMYLSSLDLFQSPDKLVEVLEIF